MNIISSPLVTPMNVLLSAFWLDWGLQLLVVLLFAAVGIIFHKLKLQKLKNENSDLLRQVLERNELLSYAKINEQKAKKEAEAANKNKTQLISKISHEIRTPMNAMMGMASLLNETDLNKEQREYTATIQQSGEGLLSVINDILMNDILEYSKVESGNELEEKDFDLRNNIEEVLDVFGVKAAKANTELIYEIGDEVPHHIVGDAFRLRQILMNLVESIFRFTSLGEIFIGVRAVEVRDNTRIKLQFEVKDTGVGMPRAIFEKISQALSQSDSFATTNDSVELTLMICKRLVNLMGGSLKVESRENAGTSFIFTIVTRGSKQSLRGDAHIEMSGFEAKKILIVDDNLTAGNALKSQLKQIHLSCAVTNSGLQALDLLKQNSAFDLVLTDLKMPQMDGLQLTQSIKLLYPDLPVVLLNENGNESYTTHAKLFDGVINKPVRNHILGKHVFSALRQKGHVVLSEAHSHKQKLSADFAKEYPLRILVAEDDKLNQKFALKILSKLGYEAQIANNGQEVLELVSHKTYDVLLMDVQMPVMNGLEATKMIRVCLTEQPVIVAMTANTLQGDREECMMAGMDDYISKPINLKDLVIVLEKCALQIRQK